MFDDKNVAMNKPMRYINEKEMVLMGLRKQPYVISECTCPDCGKIFPVPRWKGARRGNGHVKDIWCPYCKVTQKFVEGKREVLYAWK